MSIQESSSHQLISKKQAKNNDTSDDAEELDNSINKPKIITKKIRKAGKKYDQYCSFRSLEIAMNHMKKKHCHESCSIDCLFCKSWKLNKSSSTNSGDKYRYICNFKNCESAILLTHFPSQITLLELSIDPHNHQTTDNKAHNKGVPEASKPRIQQLENIGIKASRILDILREENLQRPAIRQLNNYLAQLRKNKSGPVRMSLNELQTWSENRNQIPIDSDQVFCAGFQCSTKPRKFRMFLTTKRLIQNSLHQQNCVSDATYKLIFEEYPVFNFNSR